VVAPALTRTPRRLAIAAAGLLAVAFLVAMAMSGRTRPMQNLVAFEAAGLMSEAPDQIDRVELTADGRRATFVRTASGGWRIGAGPAAADLAAGVAAHLDTSVKFMHVTVPVRTLSPDEYQSALGEYGLDPPRYTVALHAGGRPVLAARFGAKNPQELFQYVQVEGRAALYLVPVFVGQEWEQVMDAIKTP
jgi:hypothetical protein